MNRVRASLVFTLFGLSAAGCHHRARIVNGVAGVPFQPSVSTYSTMGGRAESVPPGLPPSALLDEATLSAQPGQACVNVRLRQPLAWDQPGSAMAFRCSNGEDRVQAFAVGPDQVEYRDYPFQVPGPQLEFYGYGVGIAVPLGGPQERAFRVAERTIPICCPLTAGETFKLTLDGAWGAGSSRTLRTDFQWRLRYGG